MATELTMLGCMAKAVKENMDISPNKWKSIMTYAASADLHQTVLIIYQSVLIQIRLDFSAV